MNQELLQALKDYIDLRSKFEADVVYCWIEELDELCDYECRKAWQEVIRAAQNRSPSNEELRKLQLC